MITALGTRALREATSTRDGTIAKDGHDDDANEFRDGTASTRRLLQGGAAAAALALAAPALLR